MKKLLTALICCLTIGQQLQAQQTPYDYFVPDNEDNTISSEADKIFTFYNCDSTKLIHYIKFKREDYIASFYNIYDSLLKKIDLEPGKVLAWPIDPIFRVRTVWPQTNDVSLMSGCIDIPF